MESGQNKISSSIQYQMSNVVLFNEVFGNLNSLNEKLNGAPEIMKKYLFEMWITLKNNLKNNNNVIIKDMDKKITIVLGYSQIENSDKNIVNIFNVNHILL